MVNESGKEVIFVPCSSTASKWIQVSLGRKMFWGSYNDKGIIRLINVESMINSDKYKAVLQTHLLPSMQRDFR